MIFLRFARRFTGPATATAGLLWGSALLFALALGLLEVSGTALFLTSVEWESLAWVWALTASFSLGCGFLSQLLGVGRPSVPHQEGQRSSLTGWLGRFCPPWERCLNRLQRSLWDRLPSWMSSAKGKIGLLWLMSAVWLWLCMSPSSVLQGMQLPGASSRVAEDIVVGQAPHLSQLQAVLLQAVVLALVQSLPARLWRGEYWLAEARSRFWPISFPQAKATHGLSEASSLSARPAAIPLLWMMACSNLAIALTYLGWLLWQTIEASAPELQLGLHSSPLDLTAAVALKGLFVGSAIVALLTGSLLWSQRYREREFATERGAIAERDRAEALPESLPIQRKYARALLAALMIGSGLTLLLQWRFWGEIQQLGAMDMPPFQGGILAIAGGLALLRGALSLLGLILRALKSAGLFVRHGTFTALAWLPFAGLGLCLLMGQNVVPGLWGITLLWSLDRLLDQSLRRYAQERLFRLLPKGLPQQLRQQLRLGSHGLMLLFSGLLLLDAGRMGSSPLLFLLVLASLILILLVTLAFLRYRYFQLIFAAIDQFALQQGNSDVPIDSGLLESLLGQSDNLLVKRALLRSLKRSVRDSASNSEYSLACLGLLEQMDLQLTSATLAPLLLRFSPPLQLASLAVMTRAEQQRRQHLRPDAAQQPSPYLRNVAALMTPLASSDVFTAALRFQFYGSERVMPQQLKMYMHDDYPPSVRALAASFALREGSFVSSQRGMDERWTALMTAAKRQLQRMLVSRSEAERLLASRCLLDLTDLSPVQDRIPALLEDFSSEVRELALKAIGQTRCRALYPHLLKALQSDKTEEPARQALFSLGQDAIPLLQRCTQHPEISLPTKMSCWQIMIQLQGLSACQALSEDLMHQEGAARQLLLKLMLTQSRGRGPIAKRLAAEEGVEQLLKEELWLLSHLYVALADLNPQVFPGNAAIQLGQALRQQQRDVGERLLLLLQIRYPSSGLGQVAHQLRDPALVEQGLEQLCQVVNAELQPLLMVLFDASSLSQKRLALADWSHGDRLPPAERLQQLLSMHIGLEAWPLACAYELALEQEIALSDESLLVGIHHQDPAVRSAVQAYLNRMSTDLMADFLGAAAE